VIRTFEMKVSLGLLVAVVLFFALIVSAAERYSHDDFERDHMEDEEGHNLADFSPRSFFKIHDLNSDNALDEKELLALYSFDGTETSEASRELVKNMLAVHDLDGDSRLSEAEYLRAKGATPQEETQARLNAIKSIRDRQKQRRGHVKPHHPAAAATAGNLPVGDKIVHHGKNGGRQAEFQDRRQQLQRQQEQLQRQKQHQENTEVKREEGAPKIPNKYLKN